MNSRRGNSRCKKSNVALWLSTMLRVRSVPHKRRKDCQALVVMVGLSSCRKERGNRCSWERDAAEIRFCLPSQSLSRFGHKEHNFATSSSVSCSCRNSSLSGSPPGYQ
eukprot:g20284.t1